MTISFILTQKNSVPPALFGLKAEVNHPEVVNMGLGRCAVRGFTRWDEES